MLSRVCHQGQKVKFMKLSNINGCIVCNVFNKLFQGRAGLGMVQLWRVLEILIKMVIMMFVLELLAMMMEQELCSSSMGDQDLCFLIPDQVKSSELRSSVQQVCEGLEYHSVEVWILMTTRFLTLLLELTTLTTQSFSELIR